MQQVKRGKHIADKFPIWSIENDFILTRSGDYAAVYEMILPTIYTLSTEEYEAIHALFIKAINTLPNYSVVHKQDIFIEELYVPRFEGADESKVTRFFERHFIERPYLNHTCYISFIKSHPIKMRQTSLFTSLCRGKFIPKEILDRQTFIDFQDKLGQIENMLSESGFFTLKRMKYNDLVSTDKEAGILQRYLYANFSGTPVAEDIDITESFEFENAFVARAESLFTGKPSLKAIQAIEDSSLIAIDSNKLFQLFDKHHDLERVFRKIIEASYVNTVNRIESLQFHTADERYHDLLREQKDVLKRVPLKYIASYLGITPVSLSRIRAQK